MSSFMGDTSECIAHFAATYAGQDCKVLMAEFCGVEPSTVQSWIAGQNEPTGDRITKLRVFLQLVGYRVHELDDLARSIRDLCTMVALGICSPEEVRDQLGYKNVQDVYRVLRGDSEPMRQKQERLARLLTALQPELDKRLPSWKARIEEACEGNGSSVRPSVASAAPSAPPPAIVTTVVESVPSEAVVSHLVLALSALLDGLEDTVDNDRTAERTRFADSVGKARLVKLHTQLEDLLQL